MKVSRNLKWKSWHNLVWPDDIYNLHVGDVIDLNKPQDSTVSVHVEGQPWFKGKLGVHNKNIAVKIEERTENRRSDVAV